ncbi:MAG TPA: mechanosensitive ion channel family protein [Bryobacteraceae bacterium]|nr:mechanosensitive ion channel family protein [Bryobacteraceae bacterium]
MLNTLGLILAAERPWVDRAWLLLIFLIGLGLSLLVRAIAIRLLKRNVREGDVTFTSMLLNAMRIPSYLWCITFALEVTLRNAELTRAQHYWISRAIGAFLIISISLVLSDVAVRMIQLYGERNKMAFAVAGLSRTLTHITILGIGFLLILRLFDVSITPLLTALGVGGLAVALALQDTLANFFAGVHILVENPVNLGDFVRLQSGEEGIVQDIGWRTTRIRTFTNSVIVIPNQKITSGILTNFNMPDPRVTGDIAVMVGLNADVDEVARIVIDAASNTEGVLPQYSPVLLFEPGIMLTHMQFKLVVHCANALDRGLVLSRLRVAVWKALRENQIPLPEPERVAAFRS